MLTIAALAHWHSDHFLHEALHRQAHAGMLAGQGSQWTTGATNADPAVGFDMGQRAEMLVQQPARGGNTRLESSGRSFPQGQFVGESFTSPPKQRFNLPGWE